MPPIFCLNRLIPSKAKSLVLFQAPDALLLRGDYDDDDDDSDQEHNTTVIMNTISS